MIFDRIFNNLSHHVDAWIRDWNRTNPERRRLAYGGLQRQLTWASAHVFRFLFGVFLLAAVVSFLIGWAVPEYAGIEILSDDWRQSNTKLLPLFNTIWSIQATVAALVYPIVLAFVAVMLQQRPDARVSLRLYMIDAAVLPAGLSAITLVVIMGLLYLLMLTLGADFPVAILYSVIVWLTVNGLLTAWFLYRTLRFLHDDHRLYVFEQYAVHVAFPREVRQHLSGLLFLNAPSAGYLPETEYSDDEHRPQVSLHPMLWSQGTVLVSKRLKRPRTIVDVRFRLLSRATRMWLSKAQGQPEDEHSSHQAIVRPLLVFPVAPGNDVERDLAILCRDRDGPRIGWFFRTLVKRSFVFGPPPPREASHSTTEILAELAADVVAQTGSGNDEAYRQAQRALLQLHITLVLSGHFRSESGLPVNAGRLPDPYGFDRINEEWRNVYLPVLQAAVEELPKNSAPFDSACHFCYRLIRGAGEANLDILLDLLHIPTNLMFYAGQWWAKKVEEQGVSRHDAATGAQLFPPLETVYQRALRHFIGAWEGTELRESSEDPDSPEAAWLWATKRFRFLAEFIKRSAHTLLEAVARGDIQAAHWLQDSFVNWRAQRELEFSSANGFYDVRWWRTVSMLDLSWAEVHSEVEALSEDPGQQIEIVNDLAISVFPRFWEDVRILVILLLLQWSEQGGADEPAIQIAVLLLQGTPARDRNRRQVRALRSAEQCIAPFLRQRFADEGYTNLLNEFAKDASRLRGSDAIAGRVYMSAVRGDLDSLNTAQVQLLSALDSSNQDSLRRLQERIGQQANELTNRDNISLTARNLRDAIRSERFRERRNIVATIRRELELPENPLVSEARVNEILDWMERLAGEQNEQDLA